VTELYAIHSIYHRRCFLLGSGVWGRSGADGRRLVRDGAGYHPPPLAMPWSRRSGPRQPWTLTRYRCSSWMAKFLFRTRTIEDMFQRAFAVAGKMPGWVGAIQYRSAARSLPRIAVSRDAVARGQDVAIPELRARNYP